MRESEAQEKFAREEAKKREQEATEKRARDALASRQILIEELRKKREQAREIKKGKRPVEAQATKVNRKGRKPKEARYKTRRTKRCSNTEERL